MNGENYYKIKLQKFQQKKIALNHKHRKQVVDPTWPDHQIVSHVNNLRIQENYHVKCLALTLMKVSMLCIICNWPWYNNRYNFLVERHCVCVPSSVVKFNVLPVWINRSLLNYLRTFCVRIIVRYLYVSHKMYIS